MKLIDLCIRPFRWFTTRPLIVKVIVVILLAVIGWILFSRFKTNGTQTPVYQTQVVERGNLIVSVTGSGQVSTANNVQVTTNASGVVAKILVKNGDTVTSGQKIAELELDQEGKQRYAQALSSYQSAKNNLDSAKSAQYSLQSKLFAANQKFVNDAGARDLSETDPTYIQQNADWLASEADYKRQQNVIAAAGQSLTSAWISYQQSSPAIYAPLSGTLTGFSLQLGSVITTQTTTSGSTSSQKIASVTTDAVPTISVGLTQIDIPKITVGNKATITLDAYPEKTFTGKVVSIDTVGSVSSGVTTYPAVIALDEKNKDIFPNMSTQATIITNVKPDVLLVPTTAITTQNGEKTVRVQKDGNIVPVLVEVGISSDTHTEILSGIDEGATVVTSVSTPSSGNSGNSGPSVFSGVGGSRGFSSGGAVRIQR